MRGLILLAAVAMITLAPAIAQDKPTVLIDVGRPGDRAIPIGLPFPKGGAAASQELYDVVRHDLELSGWFRVLDPNASLEPATAGIRPGEFDMAAWRPSGASVLAKTDLVDADGKLRTEVHVYAVGGAETLGAKAFSGAPTSVRTLGHRVADTIVFAVTGEHAFFDTRFAFVAKWTGNKEIWLVDADGEGRRQITRNGSINLKPRWNATGTALAFTSYQAGNPDLYVADFAQGGSRRVSKRPGINTGGAFSPKGDLIALALSLGGDAEIWTIEPLAGREVARLTASPGIDASPCWSPDGRQIAFVSERSGGPQIYVMNADGSNPHRVSFSGSHNTDPAWSPAGDRIAFVSRDSNFDVFTVGVDGQGMTRVTQGMGDNEDPSFSPDGRYVAFSSTRSGGAHIWIASVDGRHQVQVTRGEGGYTNPNWSGHLAW